MLTKDEVLDRADKIEGWMSRAELSWLYDRAAESQRILEIGVWKGRTTFVLGHACKGRVVAVDHFMGSPGDLERFQKEAQQFEGRHKIRCDCMGNLQELIEDGVVCLFVGSSTATGYVLEPLSFDMIFVDGAHDYESVEMDLITTHGLLRPGGLICGHDCDKEHPGVMQAVKDAYPKATLAVGSIWRA